MSEDYRTGLQQSHLLFSEELEICRMDALEDFDEHGPAPAAAQLRQSLRSAIESAAKHHMLVGGLDSMLRYLSKLRDRDGFEEHLNTIINHLVERPD